MELEGKIVKDIFKELGLFYVEGFKIWEVFGRGKISEFGLKGGSKVEVC